MITVSFVTLLVDTIGVVGFFPVVKILFDPNFLNKYIFANENIIPKLIVENIEFFGLLFLLIIYIAKNILTYFLTVIKSKFTLFAQANLTSLFYTNYINLDYLAFIANNTSFYARNINDNINSFFNSNLKSWIEILIEIITLIFISIFLIYLNWKNFAIFFIIITF